MWGSVRGSSSQGFTSGARVQHPMRGAGTIVEVNANDPSHTFYKVCHDMLHDIPHAMALTSLDHLCQK